MIMLGTIASLRAGYYIKEKLPKASPKFLENHMRKKRLEARLQMVQFMDLYTQYSD